MSVGASASGTNRRTRPYPTTAPALSATTSLRSASSMSSRNVVSQIDASEPGLTVRARERHDATSSARPSRTEKPGSTREASFRPSDGASVPAVWETRVEEAGVVPGWGVIPSIRVGDMAAALAFYVDELGFALVSGGEDAP